MKQELFKEMYDGIHLDKEQKNRIWNNLDTAKERGTKGAGKRFHTPAFAAICICILLAIGVPVLAANTSVVQSIINAYNTLNSTKPNLTEEQKNIYAKYGNTLDNEIVLDSGTLKLEAIINDGYNICIPFSMYIKKGKSSDKILSEISDLKFYTKDNRDCPMGQQFTMLNSESQKKKVITGCYMVNSRERVINQGEVLRMKSDKEWEKARQTGKTFEEIESLVPVVSEVTVNAPVGKRDIAVKEIQKKLPEGASIGKIQLSSISLVIEGIEQMSGTGKSVLYSNAEVELKDGSTVKKTSSGPLGNADDLEEEGYYSYTKMMLFEAPVNLDDVAGIRIKDTSLDLWIPVAD